MKWEMRRVWSRTPHTHRLIGHFGDECYLAIHRSARQLNSENFRENTPKIKPKHKPKPIWALFTCKHCSPDCAYDSAQVRCIMASSLQSVITHLCLISETLGTNKQGIKIITRKRAIAKALQLKGHPTSRQSIWRIINILCVFFVRKYCVFGRFAKFRLATATWSHAHHAHFSTRSRAKQVRKRNTFCRESVLAVTYVDLDLWPFDPEPAYWLSRAETLC